MAVKLEGFAELDAALAELGKPTTRRALGRRALKKAAQPLADDMAARAPVDQSDGSAELAESVAVSSKLSGRQRRRHRRMIKDRAGVELFVGAGPLPQAHLQEFGTRNHAPQPFARPAWDAGKFRLLDRLRLELAREIEKAVKRARRRAARERAKNNV